MQFAITPSYKDIFGKEPPEIFELIKEVPSSVIISVFSAINANLFFDPSERDTQIKIFQFLTQRFTQEQKDIIWNGLYPFVARGKGNATIFGLWYSTEFIAHELLKYRDFEIVDTTPDQEFRIFQAYLIIVERLNKQHEDLFNAREAIPDNQKEFVFEWLTWGMISKQFDFNNKIDPFYQLIKAVLTLNYLLHKDETKEFVYNFLKIVNRESYWHYVFDFMQLVKISFNESVSPVFKNFSILSNPEFEPMLNSLSIDINNFQSDKRKREDYKGLREKPLFKLSQGKYIVMNWSFFYNQIYLGLLFDFHERSGIKKLYKNFPDFRSVISKEVSEKLLFHRIARESFEKKRCVLHFDDGNNEGIPDLYLRIGKYIFLFEFKDVLMPIRVIQSSDYWQIKEDIETKFILNKEGDKKGIQQLLSHIAVINEDHFDFDDFELSDLKLRNIVVYPIIVYTHFLYSLPGVNHYLDKKFSDLLSDYAARTQLNVQSIKPLTMIDFELLFRNVTFFQDGEMDFKKIIDAYHDELKARLKKFHKEKTTDRLIRTYPSLEEIFFKVQGGKQRERSKDYIKRIFDAMNIKMDVPE